MTDKERDEAAARDGGDREGSLEDVDMEEGGGADGSAENDERNGDDPVPAVIGVPPPPSSSPQPPAVEKPMPGTSGSNRGDGKPDGKRRRWLYVAGAVFVGLAIFAIAFSIGWTQAPKSEASSPSTTSSSAQETSSFGGGGVGGTNGQGFKAVAAGEGPFNTTLGLFNQDITRGYSSVEELRTDLEQAAWFLLNEVVRRNTGDQAYYGGGGGYYPMPARGFNDGTQEIAIDAVPSADSTSSYGGDTGGVPEDLTDYGTNNQEQGVEEGDVVVSDGDLGEFFL